MNTAPHCVCAPRGVIYSALAIQDSTCGTVHWFQMEYEVTYVRPTLRHWI